MLTRRKVGTVLAAAGSGYAQSAGDTPARRNDDAAIRSLLAEGYETDWNSHQPALAVTAEKCVDDALFINTTGGWVKGGKSFAEMFSRLHGLGGPSHDHTRRHSIEELRFIRPDVALAVVKTFDIKRAGVPISGDETRGLV